MKTRTFAFLASFIVGAAFAAPLASAHCGHCGVGDKKEACPADCTKPCCAADKAHMDCCTDEACKKACEAGNPLTGQIVSIDAAKRTLVVKHDEIPGVMGAMTMSFAVPASLDLATLKAGDKIHATLVKLDGKFSLLCVKKHPAM